MESDARYLWLEKRISSCLGPKRDALLNLVENEDNKLIIFEFLNNEDVKQLYIYMKASNHQLMAARNCGSNEGDFEKGIFFLKISNSTKLTIDQMNNQVAFFESSNRILDHMDLMTRDVFMPLLCAEGLTEQSDKLMDIMHRIISQIAVAQSQLGDSVTLPVPSLSLLAMVASNPNRRLTVLHILETTIINWQKQIRNSIRQQPEIVNVKLNFYTKDEIQLWTSYINKLNNLIVQLDAPHVKDILANLENNNSAYIQPFFTIKSDIKDSIKAAEINLRYISTLTPWVHKIKSLNLNDDAQYLFTGLFHTLLLIWQHSKYYHRKERFAHMLSFLSNEIVSVSKEVVGDKIMEEPLRSYNKLKEALRICALFRGTFLDFKEKADALNSQFHKLEKKIDFVEKPIWWVQPYSNEDSQKFAEYDEYEVMRENSPWPKRNHNCFYYLNVFMERCNDVLELVQTMRHFQILSKTVSIGGSDNRNMDILAQEIHNKYVHALDEFQDQIKDVMNFENKEQNFEIAFFNMRTTIKELERELSKILNVSMKNCTTISSKLRLFQVFEGVHERDVIQGQLTKEYNWLMNELLNEFSNAKQLCATSPNIQSTMPRIVSKLFWYYGLEQRVKVPMEKFSYLYPNLLQTDLGYQLRESFKSTVEFVEKAKNDEIKKWEKTIQPELSEKLLQTVLKNTSIDEILSKRPNSLEVNLDFELEKLLKEIHYLTKPPFNMNLNGLLKDKFSQLKDENKLRLYATRMRSIVDKYNLIMKNLQQEEISLFEIKLNKIDALVELGLMKYTWNSVEIPDYIENAHSLICMDVYHNLELTQMNAKEIFDIVNYWCEYESDIFKNRDLALTNFASELEEKQMSMHETFKKEIIKGGNRIHALIESTLEAVQISEASPGWQEYINFTNEIIFNGFRISSFNSLKNMLASMIEEEQLKTPFVCIDLELIESRLLFNPPLDENTHMKNLQEILFDFINTFISRGSYMQVLGKNRVNYDQMVAKDESIFELVSKINESIEKTCTSCRGILDYFNAYSFLWTVDIHETFEEFLKGNASLSRDKQPRPPSKNFMSNKNTAKSIASLGSMLTPEIISNIERTFLSPYYQNLSKQEKEQCLTPLLEDFDSEIAVYVDAQENIKKLKNYQDINWIRIKLQPTIDVLITLTNKLIWKFTNYLSTQIKLTLNELDQFLKRMEPDIEKITGEERDTATFMKIMQMFNEVSSKQQEMEVKFELMKRTLNLLKKYKRLDVIDLESKFNSTPIRWTNLKSKVTLAKQRLGPTIQEESKVIIEDLKSFAAIINSLLNEILRSNLFNRSCNDDMAFRLLETFTNRLDSHQSQAEDLKQLQELLESSVVDFSQLTKAKTLIFYLRITWTTIKEIRGKHNEWKAIRWQKVNIKNAFEETDKQLEQLNNLPVDSHVWDVYLGTKHDINNIKNCLPIIEEIANPAMRTRHWKQLIRLSGGTALVDNETLKMLTFGQLLDLNLHAHVNDVKLIVQKAVKDLSIEQTIKTYEEIWLSKVFALKMYFYPTTDTSEKSSNDDDDKSSQSKGAGVVPAPSNKSTKRLSIGSLPQSLIGVEPIGENDPVYLFENAESLFNELEHHQIVLEDLLHNQSAGSFYDEIIKWQNTLQNIEAVLQQWNQVQHKWKRLEPIYSMNEIHTILPQDSAAFYKTDKDFRILMKATHKNSNILKCCQRKNILHILKHLNQNLDLCYESLMQETSKRRAKCPRLYLLNDEDLLEVICCGSNLESFAHKVGLVFNQLKSLKIDVNAERKLIIGCFGRNGEYFTLKQPVAYKAGVEELINNLEKAIPESLKFMLSLAIAGNQPPYRSTPTPSNLPTTNVKKSASPEYKTQVSQNRTLTPINELSESRNSAPSIYSWIFQHTHQVIELTLRILFTKQIENSLGKVEELKKIDEKLETLIEYYNKNMNRYKTSTKTDNRPSEKMPPEDAAADDSGAKNPKGAIVMSSTEHDKLVLITKLLIYYRLVVAEMASKNCTSMSKEWLAKPRYYLTSQNENDVQVAVKMMYTEVNYGFEYYSQCCDDPSFLYYNSPELESTLYYLTNLVRTKSSALLHGEKCGNVLRSLSVLLGYENHHFLCSEQTTTDCLNNVCKAMVLAGYWVTFLNLNNLNSNLMSSLSNILTQLNERTNESVLINNEPFKYFADKSRLFSYFGTIKADSTRLLVDVDDKSDSLKITQINHEFNLISKDLFEKFRAVKTNMNNFDNYTQANLTCLGFGSATWIARQLTELKRVYDEILCVKQNRLDSGCRQNGIDSSLFNSLIREASHLINNRYPPGENQHLVEKNTMASVLLNALFTRVSLNGAVMLINYLKATWPDIKLPYKYEYLLQNDKKAVNLPIVMDKETAMQIEDKIVLNSLPDSVVVATSRLKLTPSILFQTKCVNLIENLLKCKNILMVGKSGIGKTTCFKTAVSALNELGYLVNFQHIFINNYSNLELFGQSASKNGLLQEGLIANTIRNFETNTNLNILNLVGENSSKDMFYYESLFEAQTVFLNQNNEKTLTNIDKLKLLWETDDLAHISPSILSTSVLIYLEDSLISWHHIVESSLNTYHALPTFRKLKAELVAKLELLKHELDLNKSIYLDVVPVMFESKVRLVLALIKSMIKNNDRLEERDLKSIVEYCVFSGVSASMTQESREAFNRWAKEISKIYPADGHIYDYYYDIDMHQFQQWSENIPTFSCPIHQGIPLNTFVHTSSSMFLNSMLDVMMNQDESLMVVGETGCGKTSLISDKLKTSCSGDLSELFYITINTNRLTNSNYLHSRISQHLSWVHGAHYVPKGNKKMYCFIDDIHLAQINELNRQTAVEFLRQHLDSESFYDFTNKKWQRTKNINYVTTFNHKAYSPQKSFSNKLLKHFHVIAQHFPSDAETHGIYTKLLYRHLIGDIENESSSSKLNASIVTRLKSLQTALKNIVQSSIDLNGKMRSIYLEKSQRLHYVFTLRVLTSLFRHMCVSLSPDCTKEQILLLWHHECDWLYGQRMIDNVDIERYQLAYKTVVKKNFGDVAELAILNRSLYFSNLKETESGIVVAGFNATANYVSNSLSQTDGYEPNKDLDEIRSLIQIALNEYNKEQQRIAIPLYDSTITLITRLCHTTQCVGGNCCIVADGGISPFIIQLVASLMQYNLIYFKASQFMYRKDVLFEQLKSKLISSYYKAGIRGEKVMLCLTEEEMNYKDFIAYITEFLISEEVMHLFTIEEETTILNSIRTQVVQSGLVYTRETAWEFFIKNIRENTRIVIIINESAKKFQNLALENPSLFNNMELIWVQHWNMKQLVDNALYHFQDIKWLDKSSKENLAHLLASMHNSIRENDQNNSAHLNNLTYTKFVEKFKEFLIKKYRDVESSHKNVCRLLEHIQRQHSIAKKLLVQLQQENLVLEERIKSTNKMLQQIGQDMTMTEQQLKVHNLQTKKTVQLKRVLPEYQSAHERNVYKTVAIVANTKKLIQNINMLSLQELRSIQKPDTKVEDILAAVIMILKSPTADVTWHKGAKRQMANLDRFLEELQSFDEREMAENTIKLLEDLVRKIDAHDSHEPPKNEPYTESLNTLQEWIRGVLKYHLLMNKHVKPLHKKVLEIEKEVKEADQKLTTLNRKSEALNARLKDLAQNFEEATVDKKEQEEKVIKMKSQLQTASELNAILSREFERNMQIYDSVQERIFCLPGACALASGFLVYLGPYQFPFRRLMLTTFWVKCLNDRGLPLVLDSISLIKGRVVKWQMDTLSHLLAYAGDISIPGEDWKVNFASEQILNEPFIVPTNELNETMMSKMAESQQQSVNNKKPSTADSPSRMVKINEPEKPKSKSSSPTSNGKKSNSSSNNKNPMPGTAAADETNDSSKLNAEIQNVSSEVVDNNNELKVSKTTDPSGEETAIRLESNAASALSRLSEQIDFDDYFISAANYRQFVLSLIQYIIGEDECIEWMSKGASGLELENGAIIQFAERHPPLIFDPFYTGTAWILTKITTSMIDLETRNSEDLLLIEKSFQSGSKILYSNCTEIDSILLPLIYYKNSTNRFANVDDSRLLMFSNRRLFCNPEFAMYFETPSFDSFSPSTLACTTPISYHPSVENFIDEFELSIFESLFPDEYEKRNLLLSTIKECNSKLVLIDAILKNKWETNGFQDDEIALTKLALQRKYKIGEILDYCQEYLAVINESIKILTPLAIRASLLMTLSHKMSFISKNYEFSINLVEIVFIGFPSLVKPVLQDLKLKTEFSKESDQAIEVSHENVLKTIEGQLPTVPDIASLTATQIHSYSSEDIKKMTKYLTNSFLNSIIISLLPEHRLYLLTLICFYIKSEEKVNFSDLELEFLMRGKYNSNINILLSDFGVPKNTQAPNWIPGDNWNDLLAMSLLQGDLDHFVVALVSAEKEWKKWYDDPFSLPMPKIEMESDKSSKTEYVDLNEFRQLIIKKVLRPDSYIVFLNDYVTKSLELKLDEPNWTFVFQNPLFKSIIVNMGSKSNMSNTSSMSRIHKNLFQIAKHNNMKMNTLNCNFLTLNELMMVVKNAKDELLLLKNVHLASKDVLDYIKVVCNSLNNSEDNNEEKKWRLVLTKTFDCILPSVITTQSLQVSFDVIDIIAHNSVEKNRKLTVDTCQIQPDTIVFNSIQSSLNLARNDEVITLLKEVTKEKQRLVYHICVAQGILHSRQTLACNGLSKYYPWRIATLIELLNSLIRYDSKEKEFLPQHLLQEVYSNYLDDQMDKEYVLKLLTTLINSPDNNIVINGVFLPVPGSEITPQDYANWIEERLPERKISLKILDLHEKQIMYYNTIRAEEFIENLEKLWENSTNNGTKITDDLDQDSLYYSIKLCNDKLPPMLATVDKNYFDIKPHNVVAFALYQEYELFNENMLIVRDSLKNIEKYLLLNTQLFPKEWKSIAMSLQLQRVPDDWEHPNNRPSIHTLKSWIKHQNVRYNQLKEFHEKKFTDVRLINAPVIKEPKRLLNSILLQVATVNKWTLDEVELHYELKDKADQDGFLIKDLKIVGGCWNGQKKSIIKSENLVNKLPPVEVTVRKISSKKETSPTGVKLYMNHLRQVFVTSLSGIANECTDVMPFLIVDCIDEENQSRRTHKPIMTNLITYNGASGGNSTQDESSGAFRPEKASSLSAASVNIKMNLSRSNQTLQQLREANNDLIPTPESQLSYKRLTPNGPPLPLNLQNSLQRS